MKVRSDFVSNSSSSSFIICGTKVEAIDVNAEMLGSLGEGEAIFMVLPNCGSEGCYVFQLTPQLLLECDMHQIDLAKGGLKFLRGRWVSVEGGIPKPADNCPLTSSNRPSWDWDDDLCDEMTEELKNGLPLDGLRMFRINRDYNSPKRFDEDRIEMIDAIKRETGSGI